MTEAVEFPAQKFQVNGIEMSVVIAGEGPDVLLVHGFPDTHGVWRNQIPVLVEAGYRVIAPDTRGCGETAMTQNVEDYHLPNLVKDMVALLDVLGIDKVRLIGHDWGANICWRLVIAHPERVDRYIALSVGHPTSYGNGTFMQKLKAYYVVMMQIPKFVEWLLPRFNWWFFRQITRYPEELPQWKACFSRPGRLAAGIHYYQANPGMLLGREYPSVQVPVFGIWSSGDLFLTESQMIGSERYVKGPWRYARIEGANHWLQLHAPEKVNPLLLEYLALPLEKL